MWWRLKMKMKIVFLFCFHYFVVCDAYFPASIAEKEWWETSVFYQIYPRSFKDSDGDGIGDLRGISSRLEHLKDAGIGATWLSPIFASPMVDFGYDISNFVEVNEDYGTMTDFEEMVNVAKHLGIRIVLDFVPNHSSDRHAWFQKSISREEPYTDYYVWHNGLPNGDKQPLPPNNWLSVFRGSAWTWNAQRGQYYLHQFAKEQPDLNLRNERVVEEMQQILLFWLDKGVDGFRIDAVNHIYETVGLPDEPISSKRTDPSAYGYLDHIYTKDQPECYELVQQWREYLDKYSATYGLPTKIIMTESYANMSSTMAYYGDEDGNNRRAHIPFNFILITDLDQNSDSHDFVSGINKWIDYIPRGYTPNWVLGNHDKQRVGTRFGDEKIDAMNMMLMTLPGIAISYYGDEIGMIDHEGITWKDTKDPWALNTDASLFRKYSRDPCRTPFQWDFRDNSGFSDCATTWLPVHSNFKTVNLKLQHETENSHFNVYQQLTTIRRQKAFTHGSFQSLALNRDIFAFVREWSAQDLFVVVINLKQNSHQINLNGFGSLKDKLVVVCTGGRSIYKKGAIVDASIIDVGPYESLILQPIDCPHPSSNILQKLSTTLYDKLYLGSLIRLLIINGFSAMANGDKLEGN